MLIAIVVVGTAVLLYLQFVHIRRVRADRGALFDAVAGLFDDVRVQQDGLNFPVLTGRYGGYAIRLKPIVDAVALRKVPVVWLVVEQHRELPVGAPLDVLLRPQGTEFFSPNSGFRQERRTVEGFPTDARIASPDWSQAPPLSALTSHLRILSDPRSKEVYITEDGVRLVVRLAEGGQARYRTTRRADLSGIRVSPSDVVPALTALHGIGDDLSREVERTA